MYLKWIIGTDHQQLHRLIAEFLLRIDSGGAPSTRWSFKAFR